jgi:SAM-dependent methyltransferase
MVNDESQGKSEYTLSVYSDRVSEFVAQYEALSFESVHSALLNFLPITPGFVLDVGAGSGRDAAWFAERGWDVVAVEPVPEMIARARELHPSPKIQWLQDKLPKLDLTMKQGMSFDVVLVSAVLMHLDVADRARAFRKLSALVKPGGLLVISIRQGDFSDGRTAYGCAIDEIETLARQHCLAVKSIATSKDALKRADVSWFTVILQLPDDGTEALPLLRHIILNDNKSSSYKLALLRVLCKIAENARGTVRYDGDGSVVIPLGLVALYWVRMYKPLLEASIPQMPPNSAGKGLAFQTEAFRGLADVSVYDLRVGAQFSAEVGAVLDSALRDARDTIHKMPAFYTTFPNSTKQVFATSRGRAQRISGTLSLDSAYLWQFGELRMPQDIWLSMCRFGSWIEPSLVAEWIRLMQLYLERGARVLTQDQLIQALCWVDPVRDTGFVRQIVQQMQARGETVYCMWTGKRLSIDSLDIDHCFPFSAWPCNDLWNLMPADRRTNQQLKKEKLVSAELLAQAEDRICSWWQSAYCQSEPLELRFGLEASAALSLSETSAAENVSLVFDGLARKRLVLKRDLQVPEWNL